MDWWGKPAGQRALEISDGVCTAAGCPSARSSSLCPEGGDLEPQQG